MNGIIVVNKPQGWTSHDVVAKLRGVLKIKRVGHGGTLDPMATGVLPVFAGRATRAAQFCENADKEYIVGLRLGVVTDTQDITGKVLRESAVLVSRDEVSAVLQSFVGQQKQIPPMYSAIKHKGKKLYELARDGVEVERSARDIVIHRIEQLTEHGSEYMFRVLCSKGTYIRTLCHDAGEVLGCGAVMSSLQRTAAGEFTLDMARELEEIIVIIRNNEHEKCLLPIDSIFSKYPKMTLSEAETLKCKNGVQCCVKYVADGKYRVYGFEGEFLLFGQVIGGKLKMIKGFYGNLQERSPG